MTTMTGKQRLWAAIRGERVDRAPIWLREGFPIGRGPADADDFGNGWQADPLYRELYQHVDPHVDVIDGWGIGACNRLLMVPPKSMEWETEDLGSDCRRRRCIIHTPKGDLVGITETHRGEATTWHVQDPVNSIEDLRKLASVPFEIEVEWVDRAIESYHRAIERVGDRGIVRLGLSSPIVTISGCMPFDMFLELSLTERKWFHELCEEITGRNVAYLDELFSRGVEFESIANLGGSEQCTPPMMRPETYDEYVVPYDGQIIRRLREGGIPTSIHCHGKIRHALEGMVEMGAVATDPVEPPPAGDVTYQEARKIAGDRLTLIGNLEWDELEYAEPDHIRRRVEEILSFGNRRLILGASAGPISRITPRLAENVRTWVDTATADAAC
jgi:uroporphyrinogen-III decarboxylase